MKPRWRHTRRMLKWGSLAVCVAIALVWGLSLRWRISWVTDWFYCDTHYPGLNEVIGPGLWFFEVSDFRFSWLPTLYFTTYGPSGVQVFWSLWEPLVILAIVSVLLFWLDRKRPRPGHCQSCGYNLTGNVSGVCSECGEPTEAAGGVGA